MRELNQWVNLTINILIFLSTIVGMYLKPTKKFSLMVWCTYGLIGILFYVPVLVFRQGAFGNDFSPIRNLVQDTLVMITVLSFAFSDLWSIWKK